ncbi:MAG: flagellar motor switch protein FliN [Candidatus Kapabacteria bacterium]|nr:flagellar motor switch protein FliN [Candidatus Kapabacteria bacterium]
MTQEEIDALISSGGLDDDNGSSGSRAESNSSSMDSPSFPDIDFQGNNTIYSPLDPKLELLYDLQLPVSIELGRTNMLIRDILRLGRGSVVEFDKLVSEPVDVLINGKKVAEGEVVVIDKHFGIRVTTLVDPSERLRGMRK